MSSVLKQKHLNPIKISKSQTAKSFSQSLWPKILFGNPVLIYMEIRRIVEAPSKPYLNNYFYYLRALIKTFTDFTLGLKY